MLSYQITSKSIRGENAIAQVNNGELQFDASSGREDGLANPAELLLTSLAACILKNVERFSEILKYEYVSAEIVVNGKRNDAPPYISEINYTLKVESTMDRNKLNLLHKNILKFGTITNTLSKATELNGTIDYITKLNQ